MASRCKLSGSKCCHTRRDMRPLSHAFQSLNRTGVAAPERSRKGPFAFRTGYVAQASFARSGAYRERDDGRPNRKRVEVHSAAMTPAQGVVWTIATERHSWGLQRVPLMTDATRPPVLTFVRHGSRLPGTLEARYLFMFVVTKEWLHQNKSPSGGFFAAQIHALGLRYPQKKGWVRRAEGMQITDTQKAAFEAGSVSKSAARAANRKANADERKAKKSEAREFVQKAQREGYEKARKEWEAEGKTRSTRKSRTFVMTDAFLSTYEWRVLRMKALTKYGAVCQCCGASRATGAVMNVDHIKPRRLFPHLALDLDNLQILCHECNHGKSNWDMTDWREPQDSPVEYADEAARNHMRSLR